jgi:putative ABC transport system permease protein
VGGGSPLPLSGRQGLLRFGVRVEDRPAPSADNRADRAYLRWATPGYFQAIGIPLRAGRGFEPRDRTDAPAVAVVDETFVARYLPGEDPVGRRIRMSNERQPREIVGVVGAVRQTALDEAAEPHVYVPQSQNASPVMTFVLRSDGDPRGLAPAVRDRLRALDPNRPVYGIRTLDHLVAGSVAGRRLQAGLLAIFAALAGTLTLVGVYGLVAYWIGESRKEIGVRLALGATPRSVLAGLVGRTLRVAVPGAAAGCLLALAGARLASGLLYGVAPADPLTFAAATLLVLAAAVVATCLPARRVLAIDPSDALRAE